MSLNSKMRKLGLAAALVLTAFGCTELGDGQDVPPVDTWETITGEAWLDSFSDADLEGDLPCVPDCADKECGDDGCGGETCGKCTQGFLCEDFACVHDCDAACEGLACGDGGTDAACDCGQCADGYGCTDEGQCSAECGELCADLECGAAGVDDECDCGTCAEYYVCVDGTCDVDCDAACELAECTPEWAAGLCDCGACDDGNPCTDDACQVDGVCVFAGLDGVGCDDDDHCTGDGLCQAGICVAAPVICDDENTCTDDSCDPDTGDCVFEPNDADCDDGDPCTVGDQCAAGVCAGIAMDCECVTDTDCDEVDDGDLCNGTLFCDTTLLPHLCKVDPVTVVECDDPDPEDPDAPCLQPACDPATGECGFAQDNEGFPCADEDLCTVADYCEKGECLGGVDANCNDGNPCTDDSCDPALGCVNTPNDDPCEDGNPCTIGDQCQEGECVHGPPPVCDDGDICTDDLCDPGVLGGCVSVYNLAECDDGDVCTLNDACFQGECVGEVPLDCNDFNPCTDDSCDPLSGCIHTPNTAVCDDGDPCTATDSCIAGFCTGSGDLECDDLNTCTVDLCEPGAGCTYLPGFGICDDGNPCTLGDACVGGVCEAAEFDDCDDGNICTTDSCDPVSGCVNAPNKQACNDGDACTILDLCQGGSCNGTVDVVCMDLNPCTANLCDPNSGCQFPAVEGQCDDGNACTDGDLCQNLVCTSTSLTNCDDGDVCTDDWCEPAVGCVYGYNNAPCDDGDPCTDDMCDGGSCIGAPVICGDGSPCTDDGCEVPVCQPDNPEDCDDGNPCTDDACVDGLCKSQPGEDVGCSDGNQCTTGDHCDEGECVSEGPTDCDDGNPCTDDWCEYTDGCQSTPNDLACTDGDACTVGDVCEGGQCTSGQAVSCDDGNTCTDDSCDPASGCVNAPNQLPCDDGNACTTGDICTSGACAAAGDLDCDDGNTCTLDNCDPVSGCVSTPTDGPCSDGDACTAGDVCAGGVCQPGPTLVCGDDNPCTDDSCLDGHCVFLSNDADCDDGNACTLGDHCGGSQCVYTELLDCDDGDPCTTVACDPVVGCTGDWSDAPCDDGDPCTVMDTCQEGACVGLTPVSCDDENPCTDDACEPGQGCINLPNSLPCDDNSACTTEDVCAGGICQGVGSTACDDLNPCTEDICLDEGGCDYVLLSAIPCSDQDLCTSGDACQDGQCQAGLPLDCDDGNPCTDDLCEPATGCFNPPVAGAPCDDGDACTDGDACQDDGACASGTPLSCDDQNACTKDSCDPAAGCIHVNVDNPCSDFDACTIGDECLGGVCTPSGTLVCDDGNPCTNDSCEPTSGCQHAANTDPCDDGSVCTTSDQCAGGECVPGPVMDCDDLNVCTDDSCDPAEGCVNAPNYEQCSDFDACTTGDACVEGQCQVTGALDCDDGNPCTDDSCEPLSGCQNIPNEDSCTDGNACTEGDHCVEGACVYVSLTDCNDGNVCTTDSCDPETGCVHEANTEPCDDGDACTSGDTCADSQCAGGAAVFCDDQNVCTDDSCDPAAGCVFTNNQEECDDLNECTTGDVCGDGECHGAGSMECDDGLPCTKDVCLPDGGCESQPLTGDPCSDGDLCTVGDVCLDGQCQAGAPMVCDDGNVCTDDACVDGQCQFTANDADCTDGNACTEGDHCEDKECVFLYQKSCDDGNVCTTDSCDPLDDCQNIPNDETCDDGDACTTGDYCTGGQCVPAGFLSCDDFNPCTDDSCHEDFGCQNIPNIDDCSDGDACTVGDACQGGVCLPGAALDCDDQITCTVDSCHPASGCLHVPVDAVCNDEDYCTIDSCDAMYGCQNVNQPVDCVMGTWSPWSPCSEPCGGGERTRTREIEVPMDCGGVPCGPTMETEACNTDPCPVDCEWHWGAWSECAGGCPDGEQTRTIVVDVEPMYGGAPCPEGDDAVQTQTCSMVDTACSDGDACTLWDICTPEGCLGEPAAGVPVADGGCDDGIECTLDECEDVDGQMSCENTNQAVDCVVGGWSAWSACASDDGGCEGTSTRTRDILVQPMCGGQECPTLSETEFCFLPLGSDCDDDIYCTAYDACDGQGTCQGIPVDGACDDLDDCTADVCDPGSTSADPDGCTYTNVPVDCQVSDWGPWGICTNEDDTCVGSQLHTRTVILEPACGGEACPPLEESQPCAMTQGEDCDDGDACTVEDICDGVGGCAGVNVPVDCDGYWSDWSDCVPEQDCYGSKTRTFTVTQSPECGGAACPTSPETAACDMPEGTLCRESADICDTAEYCTGTSPSCPTDMFKSPSTECRSADGICDTPENCTGTSPSCPTDTFKSPSTECRAAVDDCDAAEFCTGTGASCPTDELQPPGTDCDDGDDCTVYDECDGLGDCAGIPAELVPEPDGCDDLDDCTTDICSDAQEIGGTTPSTGSFSHIFTQYDDMCLLTQASFRANEIVLSEETAVTALAAHLPLIEPEHPGVMLSLNLYADEGTMLGPLVACAKAPADATPPGDVAVDLDAPVILPAGTYWLTAIMPGILEIGMVENPSATLLEFFDSGPLSCECAPGESFPYLGFIPGYELNFWVVTGDGCVHVNNPVDCEVSEWGPWSDCVQIDDGCDGTRTRTRTVTQPPLCDGAACPGLEETEACYMPQDTTCDDGDPCTLGDVCDVTGGCWGTPAVLVPEPEGCDDLDDCTQDGCTDVGGAKTCSHDDICIGAPVINEIDYDQPGSDTMEFVEIMNPTSDGVNLSQYTLEFVNGATDLVYGAIALDQGLGTNLLGPGEFLVLGSDALLATLPPSTLQIPLGAIAPQNGAPDGLRIVNGVVTDGLAYEGPMPGTGEGDYAPADLSAVTAALGRCPDGFDTDDNWTDFDLLAYTTPGTFNACGNPLPVDCEVSGWSAWGPCSEPCGGGTQTRTRTVVLQPKDGGAACPDLEETQDCNMDPCDGACCIDGTCQVTSEYDCYMAGGAWDGSPTCDGVYCGGGDLCSEAIELGYIYDYYEEYGVTNFGFGDDAYMPPGACLDHPFEVGLGAEDIVYHFGFAEYAEWAFIGAFCEVCGLDQVITMYLVDDCGDIVGTCVTGPTYSSESDMVIESYVLDPPLQNGVMYYLIIDGLTPGDGAYFDLYIGGS